MFEDAIILAILPIVVGIVQVIGGFVEKKTLPIFALVVGIIIALLAYGLDWSSLLIGLIAGLSSVGLYSGTKNLAEHSRKAK